MKKELNGESATKRVRKLLEWMMDHNLEDTRVTVGCKECREVKDLMAATALTAWLTTFHLGHQVWIRNPFRK